MLEDTIIAISTPPGQGGLGIIRISGKSALGVARRIFRAAKGTGRKPAVQRAEFGYLYDRENKRSLDEGFLTFFQGPHSYTGEDVVELSFHGSPVVLEMALQLGVQAGARVAQPGEFTLRAYLNGRIDILQAEAVNDLIRAVSPAQALVSYRQASGTLSRRISGIKDRVVQLVAQLEAAIEFPEDGLRIDTEKHARAIEGLSEDLEGLAASYEKGKALRGSLTLAIVGSPNVGKSTLFNALLEEDRAIVTPYPGTTRDFLRERMIIKDAVFLLIDMAGLGSCGQPVEKAGMEKSRKMAEEADGLILVVDGSRRENREDERLLRKYARRKSITVINKCDLPRRINVERIRSLAEKSLLLQISALKGNGLDILRDRVYESFAPVRQADDEVILHVRQRNVLEEILKALRRASRLLKEGYPEEVIVEEIRTTLPVIGRLTGEIRVQDVVDNIFSRFCVGK